MNSHVFYENYIKKVKDRKIIKQFKKIPSKIIVVRFNNDGEFRSSEPCMHCLHCLKAIGVKEIYYSVDEGIIKKKISEMTTDHISNGNIRLKRTIDDARMKDKSYQR